jgi:hypothetical protein
MYKLILISALMIVSSSAVGQSYGYDNSYNEYRYRSQTPGLNGYSNADMIRDQNNHMRRQFERDMIELDIRSNVMRTEMLYEGYESGSTGRYNRY